MAASPTVLVRFIADAKDLRKGVDDADSATSGFKANLLKVGAAIGIAFSATKVVEFAKDSIKAAQDLNANLSRTQTIFGDAAGGVIDFSKTTAKSMGLAQADSLAAANAIGKTLVGSMGLSTGAAADMSVGVVNLAKDMATFNRVPFDQALEAVQKGLSGSTRGLKDLGVVMSDAEIKQKAVTLGLSDGQKALDPTTKAQASYALMLEKTTLQQGATERASGSLSAKQDQMKAQWKDMQAKLGQALLPALTELAKILADIIVPALKSAAGFFEKNSGWILVLAGVIVGLVAAYKVWILVQTLLNFVMSANPILLIVMGIAALVAGIIIAYNKFSWFKDIVDFLWGALKAGYNWIKDNWPLLLAILTGPFGLAVLAIIKNWDKIVDFFSGLPGKIWDFLKALPGLLVDLGTKLITGFLDGIVAAASAVWDFFTGLPGKIWDLVKDIGSWLIDTGWKMIQGFIDGYVENAKTVWNFFTGLPGKIWDLVKGAGKWLFDAGKKIIEGLIDGAEAAIDGVKDFFGGIGKKIMSWKGPLDYDRTILAPAGKAIMQGLTDSLTRQLPDLRDVMQQVTDELVVSPKIPGLAAVTRPTLALAMAGREIVAPEPTLALARAGRERDIVRSEGRSGPALTIAEAHFHNDADIELLARKMEFLVNAGRL